MKTKQFFIVLVTILSVTLNAQNTKEETIDFFIEKTLSEFKEIPSIAISVVKDNKPYFIKTYGYTDSENKIKATTASPYYIASLTKSFVGLLAAQLEQEGLLDLNKPITEYTPIKNFKDNSVFKNVTITNLLSHTSGINNVIFTWRYASIGEYTTMDMIRVLEEKTSSLKNNKSYRYDNFGYNVFGLILSEEFGLNWKDLLQEKIFNPLQMVHTSSYLSKAEKNNWNIAKPYTSINEKRLPELALTQKDDQTFQSAGGIIMSIEDAQKWLLINMNNGELNGKQLLNKDVVLRTQSSISITKNKGSIFNDNSYGLGWTRAKFGSHDALYHFGGFDGYFSHISFLPEDNIGIAVFTNESHFGDNVSNLIASFIYDLLLENIKNENEYQNKVNQVANKIKSIQQDFADDRLDRANRKWTLMHDFENYSGNYENKYVGTLHIETYKNTLKANIGISTAIATPSYKDDSIRVEFKNGQGSDILFVSNNKGTFAAVFGGNVYLKKQ
ncbi:CubicO group peptidase, beta-lactamase class C family [Flaviramulus basaltis]|uniref:CubicO group peptidase, beta-lactamase class C family n=1 Tax=Flaviramulus basaltis TaxID=369401 RepID=A0A1K2IMD3_9FLAO|nr:serine hydrolase domain-containing protein [Flaviramulus basaltis]SFZ92827.1 CubicO group peptidase, beta-lactamase class C family [Flaviramulus basaltis]